MLMTSENDDNSGAIGQDTEYLIQWLGPILSTDSSSDRLMMDLQVYLSSDL
jgi:hypothetical protein